MLNWPPSFVWDAQATWPYFAEHQHFLAQALDLEPSDVAKDDWLWHYHRAGRHKSAFDVLSMFPQIPDRFVEPCWEAALTKAKAERPWAQKALVRVPDRFARLVAALKGSKQEVRASAAEWLGRLGDHHAIEPLKQALAKEKHDVPRGAAMAALEKLGVPVDEFLDRPGLLREAENGLGKGVPEDLTWFPFEQLPPMHWQDTGEQIGTEVLKWWIVAHAQAENA